MHRSNRDGVNQAALGIWFWVAMLIALCAVILAHSEQSRHHKTASVHAEQYRRDADKRISQTCISLTRQAKANCVNIAQEIDREGQRKEYDLYSQRSMAIWTIVMGYAAIFGVSLSGIGVYLIWTTFEETRKAATASSKSYDAFIAFENAGIDVRFSEQPKFIKINDLWYVYFKILVRNVGRSPAIINWVEMEGEDRLSYQMMISGGESFSLSENLQVVANKRGWMQGCICYTTTIHFSRKRVFVIGIDVADSGQPFKASIHPGIIVDEGEEGYDNPFELEVH